MTLSELSALPQPGFVAALDGIYEHSPWVAERAFQARPFDTLEALHAALSGAVATAGAEAQLALLRAHPELAGRAAVRRELTALSEGEQAGAGLDRCSPEEFAELTRLNAAYQARFDMPFVIAVRGLTPGGVIDAMRHRLQQPREAELAESLRQVERIAWLRLQDRFGRLAS